MRPLLRGSTLLIAAVLVVGLAAGASGARKVRVVKASKGPIETSIEFENYSLPEDKATEITRIGGAGAKYVIIHVSWRGIAPTGDTVPVGFNPRDPADPNYRWDATDTNVKAIADGGLKPIIVIEKAPLWAEAAGADAYESDDPGTYEPSPSALADFLTAAAQRYGGGFQDSGSVTLPRVQYWSIWNEPNLGTFLNPQYVGKKFFAPTWYRTMLNAGADAIHAVHADNVAIGGETAPFGSGPGSNRSSRPITFMEKVLCVGEKKVKVKNKKTGKVTYKYKYKSACKAKTKVDAWSHHPYTQGGPTKTAKLHGDASLGDMNTMRLVLNTAIKKHHVVSSQKVRLLVTEISWDSKPPDPKGVPMSMEARWISEMLYRMWSSGVSMVSWYRLTDQPFETSIFQSGLYFNSPDGISASKPKPILRAFRFPFVALKQAKAKKKPTIMLLWGRTPMSTRVRVIVERKTRGKWKPVKKLKANRYGIFKLKTKLPPKTKSFRARLADKSDQSIPFSVKDPKHPWKGCVWGSC
jgi:hypothetical protein